MKKVSLLVWLCLSSVLAAGESRVNLALHRPYTLTPSPSYYESTEPGDSVQLTDGETAKDLNCAMWVQKSTVGWLYPGIVTITIDLGKSNPIGGIDFSTAAIRDVGFPSLIHIWTSEDGKKYRFGGELISVAGRKGLPDSQNSVSGYRGQPSGAKGTCSYTFQAEDLKLCGRYIKLVVLPGGQYLFCDEIKVWKGEVDPKGVDRSSIELTDKFDQWTLDHKWTDIARVRMLYDLQELEREPKGGKFAKEIVELRQEVLAMPNLTSLDMSKGLPYTDLHARIWALNGKIQREVDFKDFIVWPASRYSPLHPFDVPGKKIEPLRVNMIGNEYRSAAINLSNFSGQAKKATITVNWNDKSLVWKGSNRVILRQVRFIESQMRFISDKPLPKVETSGENTWTVDLPAGVTEQVWLTFHSVGVPRGDYAGDVKIELASAQMETLGLRVIVHAGEMGAMPILDTYMWEYLNLPGGSGAVTAQNQAEAFKTMREYLIFSNWFNRWDMPIGSHQVDGHFGVSEDQFKKLDAWLKLVTPARRYYMFIEVHPEGDDFYTGGHKAGTPEYEAAVRGYFTDLARHLKKKGYDLSRFVIETMDEPSGLPVESVNANFIQIAKRVVPEFKFFEDPIYSDVSKINQPLMDATDILTPKLMCVDENKPLLEYYQTLAKSQNKELNGYDCSQNSLVMSANGYYRLNAWKAWQYGMKGLGVWVYMYNNKPNTWDNFGTMVYDGLVFVTLDRITPSKNLEAWREGMEDYEYYHILKSLIDQGERKGLPSTLLSRAKILVEKSVIETRSKIEKSLPKVWGVDDPFDQTRIELLTMIDNLTNSLQSQEAAK